MPHLKLTTNQTVPLRSASFTIGSDPTCDLPLAGRSIAPRHLILQSRGDQWQAAKLALRVPAFINDRPITALTILRDGDRIRVGDVTVVWREQNASFVQSSPWKGLLIIFLTIIAMLCMFYAWYSFSGAYQPGVDLQLAPASRQTVSPNYVGESESGHPVYRLEIPPPAK